MKKTVKLLSVVMTLVMLFSMMTVSASAIIDSEPSQGGIILGGGDGSVSVSESGNMVIGADQRPENDAPYIGARIEDIKGRNESSASASVSLSASERLAKIEARLAAQDEEEMYTGNADGYPGIEDSTDENVLLNKDFLMYVRDNKNTLLSTEAGSKTVETAYMLFGEEAVDGPTPDLDAMLEEYYSVIDQMDALVAAYDEAVAAAAAAAAPAAPAEGEAPAEGDEAAEGAEEAPAAEAAPAESEAPADEAAPAAEIVNVYETEEYLALEAKAMELRKELRKYGKLPGGMMLMASMPTNYSAKWKDISSQGSSLADAVSGGGTVTFKGPSFDICNSTDYRITVNLQGATINAEACDVAFLIKPGWYGGTITFTNGTINGNGFYVCDGGVLNLGGLINTTQIDITVNGDDYAVCAGYGEYGTGTAVIGEGTTLNSYGDTVIAQEGGAVKMTGGIVNGGTNSAVYVTGADSDGNGSLFEMCSSICEVVNNYKEPDTVAILAEDGGDVIMHGGRVYGPTGVYVTGAETSFDITGGSVTGFAKPNGESHVGAAIAFSGNCESGDNSSDPMVFAFGGTLRSEYNAAVYSVDNHEDYTDGTKDRQDIKNISVDTLNVTVQQKLGEKSDFAQAVALVNNVGFASLDDAITEANSKAAAGENVTIKLIADCEASTNGIDAAGQMITFDGNGHTITAPDGTDGLTVTSGKVNIENVKIQGEKCNMNAITVNDGVVSITGVSVKHCDIGLEVDAGEVNVNGFDVDADTRAGFSCTAGDTTVIMCKVDSGDPIDDATASDALTINGGWFLHKESVLQNPAPAATVVAAYVDPDVSYVKYVEKDRYYEVLYNDTPTVEIVSGATGYDGQGNPYVKYDKADPDPIIFKVTPAVKQITAISRTATKDSYPLFTAEAGKSGDIRISDSYVLRDCPTGAYDLEFEFMNGYKIKDKLSFYVFPKTAKLFKVPNIKELSPSDPNSIVEYLKDKNLTDTYSVGKDENIVVVMSELCDHVTVGNVADGTDETVLENYIPENAITHGIVNGGDYDGCHFYFISYADLNNLAAGQNYVFLEWDGIDGALKRLPLTIKNTSVSISPTELDWSKIDSYANFTVKPSVDVVYIDGERVEDSYWSFNNDNKVLSIKGSYLKALENKDHTVEVITPMGKVSATLNTGIGLRSKNIDYHVYGGAKSLSFVTSDKINKEAGVWIGSSNPTKLDPSAYTWDGDTGFTLSAAFLNRLALGTYYISCYVYNGSEYQYTTTTFKVISASQASYTPSTGDSNAIYIWLAIFVLAAVALVVIILPKFKKTMKNGKK